MVKNVVFVMTHLGSGWEVLAARLGGHPRVEVFETGRAYRHPEDVDALRSLPHKQGGAAAVWVDVLLHNHQFTMRQLCAHYKMLFWAAGPCGQVAADYYACRMEGLRQYHRRCALGWWNPPLEQDQFFAAVLG